MRRVLNLKGSGEMTVREILSNFNDIAVLDICENNIIGHAYFGKDEIAEIGDDILNKEVMSYFVVKRSDGFHISLEI